MKSLVRGHFAGALAALAVVAGPALGADAFPNDDVFSPLIADPKEPRFYLSWLSVDRSDGSRVSIASIGAGTNFGLLRWPGEKAGEGWQLGIFGSISSQFNMDTSGDDLINSDYRIGLPLSYKRGAFSARARVFHQSSHLGDEVILNGGGPQHIDLSFEAVDFLAAWQIGNWRAYGGGSYIMRTSMEDLKKGGAQAGVDYAGQSRVLGGRPLGGVDFKWYDENNWRTQTSAKLGLQYGRETPEKRGMAVFLEAFDGAGPGQYLRNHIKYAGASVRFDL